MLNLEDLSGTESLTQEMIEYIGLDNKEWDWIYIRKY